MSDRNHAVADLDPIGVVQFEHWKWSTWPIELDQSQIQRLGEGDDTTLGAPRQIGFGITAHVVRLQIYGQAGIGFPCLLLNDDVSVRQYESILLNNGAGAAAAPMAAVGISYDHHNSWRGELVNLAGRQITR
jgi:hypothetical protein